MSFSRWRTDFCGFVLVALLAAAGSLGAQEKAAQPPPAQEEDPLNRPLTEKQRKEQEKRFKKEVSDTYKKWLDEEVRWIITGEEMQAFKQLSNDDERDQFIEQFWLRRDPTPDTIENEAKEEHYRRIVYANERFAAGKPGWRTDRGRIYIMFGPPDQIESHAGGTYQRPFEEGGGSTSAYPFEKWRYRYIEAIGEQEVEIEFVDTCMCGAYDMEMDRSRKDALLNVPGAGLTLWEEMGMANKTDRFDGRMERLGRGLGDRGSDSKMFDRLILHAKLNRPPPVKFKDLQEAVTSKIRYNLMPFEVRADFVKLTSENVLMPVTIQLKNKDVTFITKEGIARGTVNILGQVRTMTGRIVQTFEDTVSVDVPAELLPRTQENASVYWKAFPLRSGRYRLDVVVKDVNGDRMGSWTKGILVPTYDEEKLAHSTLILADVMERVSTKTVGSGNFVIGDTKVRPRVDAADGKPATFKRDQALNLWMQVYNLGIDEASKKANATFEYEVVNTTTNQTVVKNTESTEQLGNAGQQVTLEKKLSLASLEPGTYQLTIKVNDTVSKQQIAPTAKFIVQ